MLKVDAHAPGATYKLQVSLRSDGGTDSQGIVRVRRVSKEQR
jgi:hypothetical protein